MVIGRKKFYKVFSFFTKRINFHIFEISMVVPRGTNCFLYITFYEEAHRKSKRICDVIVETYIAQKYLTYNNSCRRHAWKRVNVG